VRNVCARGGDREAVILHIDFEKNQIHVHYVGGRDDEDEWVPCEPQRVQLPPMLEKALSKKHAKAKEVQPLFVVCRLSPTVASVLLASTRELLKGTAMAGLLSSRLRRGPPRKKRATRAPRMHSVRRRCDIFYFSYSLVSKTVPSIYLYARYMCKHVLLTRRAPLLGVVSSRMPESARRWRRRPQRTPLEPL
jgi:hypothetical protein